MALTVQSPMIRVYYGSSQHQHGSKYPLSDAEFSEPGRSSPHLKHQGVRMSFCSLKRIPVSSAEAENGLSHTHHLRKRSAAPSLSPNHLPCGFRFCSAIGRCRRTKIEEEKKGTGEL
jgi:hypothetical protein